MSKGSLLASGSDLSQRGGTVQIDTNGTPGSNVTLNSTFGYENIAAAQFRRDPRRRRRGDRRVGRHGGRVARRHGQFPRTRCSTTAT